MQYYFTYVLQSESDKLFYTGYTKDIDRVKKHGESEYIPNLSYPS